MVVLLTLEGKNGSLSGHLPVGCMKAEQCESPRKRIVV
jgi:hypothetical protein